MVTWEKVCPFQMYVYLGIILAAPPSIGLEILEKVQIIHGSIYYTFYNLFYILSIIYVIDVPLVDESAACIAWKCSGTGSFTLNIIKILPSCLL